MCLQRAFGIKPKALIQADEGGMNVMEKFINYDYSKIAYWMVFTGIVLLAVFIMILMWDFLRNFSAQMSRYSIFPKICRRNYKTLDVEFDNSKQSDRIKNLLDKTRPPLCN